MPRCPTDRLEQYAELLTGILAEAECNTVTRAAALLGQLAVESGELRHLEELSDGSGYEGRLDLGNTEPGDGRKYKGRGWIQLTGRSNYKMAAAVLDLPLVAEPELAADPQVSARVVAWYWTHKRINERADALRYERVTSAVNGGTNHHARRLAYYHRALEVLGRTR